MKKLLLIGTAAMLVSTSVFATQARLLALGMKETDNEGMYHISDARNMFLNPAYVNLYPNEIVAEWGSKGFNASAAGTASNATVYRTNAPKAQGGAFHKFGDLVFGVYLGNESNTSSLLRIAGTSAAAALNGAGGNPTASQMLHTADNVVDVFVAGDAGVKWGVDASYAAGKNETNSSKDSSGAVRMGVLTDTWDAHLNVSVNSKSEATDVVTPLGSGALSETVNHKFEGKLGFQVGGSYVITGNNRVFGYVKHYGWEQSDSYSKYTALQAATAGTAAASGGQQGTVKGDFTSYHLGWGSHSDVGTTDKVYYSVAARKTDINLKFNTKGEVRHIAIPLTIGYEAVANEWLTLRGSIIQNLWSQRDNKGLGGLNVVGRSLITGLYGNNGKATLANSTEVNAGATLTYGQLSVDGLIGMTAPSRGGTVQEKNQGVFALDNLSSSVAVTYKY
jgi:hypothetical protein